MAKHQEIHLDMSIEKKRSLSTGTECFHEKINLFLPDCIYNRVEIHHSNQVQFGIEFGGNQDTCPNLTE